MPAVKVSRLDELSALCKDVEVIAIDEGQFFEDIVEFADRWANSGKIVVIAALDATFERKVGDDH
jgi:thymidine kinase